VVGAKRTGHRALSLGALGTVATLAALVALAALPGSAPPASATTGSNAATLYRQAIATTKAWSVHYTSSSSQSKITLVEIGNAGPASGTQLVSMGPNAQTQPDNATIEVIGGITYLRGNVGGLENLAGFGASQATEAANQWIEFATDNSLFSAVVAGVRSSDIAKELTLKGPLTLGKPRTLDGVDVEAIEGTQKFGKTSGRVVLYVRARGSHVPVEEDSLGANGQPSPAEHVTYSSWGETVRPEAPQATVSIGHISTT
jgi:hypothetical protein